MTRRASRRSRSCPDLATYLRVSGETQQQIAEQTGTSQAHISRIAAGDVVPRSRLAARLVAYTRIPLDSFTKVYIAKHCQEESPCR